MSAAASSEATTPTKAPKVLLVIECTPFLNWYKVFADAKVNGHPIQVEQAEWGDISLVSYGKDGCVASMRRASKPFPGTSQERERTFKIDFVLVRSVSRQYWNLDSRNFFWALMHSNVPSVNSLESCYVCFERPTVYGALLGIQQRVGQKNFPLIPQTYYPGNKQMLMTPDVPMVVKIGAAHAGYGKMKITNMTDFQDLAGVIALTPHYATAEKFITWQWDGRVQKIGNHYRVFKRTSQNWKGNVGNMSIIETIEMTDEWKMWADECAKLFGGMDILGLDFVASDGKYVILELNDTAIGLVHEHEEEDMGHMRDIVLLRMENLWGDTAAAAATPSKRKKTKELTAEVSQLEEQVKLLQLEVAREKQLRKTAEAALEEAKNPAKDKGKDKDKKKK